MAAKQADIELNLKDCVLSFLHCFEPQEQENEDGTPSWNRNVSILIPKKLPDGSVNPQVKMLNDAVRQAIDRSWPPGADGKKKVISPDRRCFRDGEPIDPDTVDSEVPGSGKRYPLYEGYEGCMYASAKKPVKASSREAALAAPTNVKCIGPRKTAKKPDGTPCFPILTEADGMLYSGCRANVLVRIYGYKDKKGKNPDRVNASLEIIQFKAHGQAFGARPVDENSAMDEEDGDENSAMDEEDGDDGMDGGSEVYDDDIG